MDIYDAAKQFDHQYDGFRVDASPSYKDKYVKIKFCFYMGECSKDVVASATREVYRGIEHQIRPFGTSSLHEEPSMNDYTITIKFKESKITDVGVTGLLNKLTHMAEILAKKYGMV